MLILVAHPDDETLGCGGEMEKWPDCLIVHTTNGSPRNSRDAVRAGFLTAEAYRDARQNELRCALAEVGGRETQSLDFIDGDSWRDLGALTARVRSLLEEEKFRMVVTHSYEGGHPDHDAAAFAVQEACRQIGFERAPERFEATFYNRFGHEFLPGGGPSTDIKLSPVVRARKDRMFACFASQQSVLVQFSTQWERFRPAPVYDFTKPPHEGVLLYESWGWEVSSALWLKAANYERS